MLSKCVRLKYLIVQWFLDYISAYKWVQRGRLLVVSVLSVISTVIHSSLTAAGKSPHSAFFCTHHNTESGASFNSPVTRKTLILLRYSSLFKSEIMSSELQAFFWWKNLQCIQNRLYHHVHVAWLSLAFLLLLLSLSHPLSFPLQSAYCNTPTHAAGMKRERQMGGVRVEGWGEVKEGRKEGRCEKEKGSSRKAHSVIAPKCEWLRKHLIF